MGNVPFAITFKRTSNIRYQFHGKRAEPGVSERFGDSQKVCGPILLKIGVVVVQTKCFDMENAIFQILIISTPSVVGKSTKGSEFQLKNHDF